VAGRKIEVSGQDEKPKSQIVCKDEFRSNQPSPKCREYPEAREAINFTLRATKIVHNTHFRNALDSIVANSEGTN
jgi:hypothetical protein